MSENSTEALRALYKQIEEICLYFKEIRSEAKEIAQDCMMPDASLHLHDVLQSTEEATTTILDAATAIGQEIGSNSLPQETREKVEEHISRIYEACGFQDISGQRIKKVLNHLANLEERLSRLSESARGQVAVQQQPKDPLLNGPQLSANAPSQQEIDKLFGTP